MTSGLTMMGFPGGAIVRSPATVSRWLSTSAHAVAAGDHTTGRGPFSAVSGHPCSSSVVAAPDDLELTDTSMQRPPICASSDPLNRFASLGISGNWLSCTAIGTAMQSSAAAGCCCATMLANVATTIIVVAVIAPARLVPSFRIAFVSPFNWALHWSAPVEGRTAARPLSMASSTHRPCSPACHSAASRELSKLDEVTGIGDVVGGPELYRLHVVAHLGSVLTVSYAPAALGQCSRRRLAGHGLPHDVGVAGAPAWGVDDVGR